MTTDQLNVFWATRGDVVTLAALAAGAVLVVVSFLLASRRGRVQRWLATAANLAVLALSAEGMWMVATVRLGLPAVFAAAVFFVTEAMLVSEAMLAARHYRRHGRPGPHGAAVWIIAAVSGVIVATNSASFTEVLLRLALPLAVAGLWWAGITEDGNQRGRGSWRWTPRRALISLGALTADDADVEQVNREHTIRVMTRLARRVHHETRPDRRLAVRRLRRLERLALRADDQMLADVQHRVARAARVADLTNPHPNRPDMCPDTGLDIAPDICPGMSPAGRADTSPAPETPDGRTLRRLTTRARIAQLTADHPDMSRQDIARRAGIDERTVRRHLAALRTADSNGHAPATS